MNIVRLIILIALFGFGTQAWAMDPPSESSDSEISEIHIIVVGQKSVGKSALLRSLCEKFQGQFGTTYWNTDTCEIMEKEHAVKLCIREVDFWKTCRLAISPYRDADVCIILFDPIKNDSRSIVAAWRKEVEEYNEHTRFILVATKCDSALEDSGLSEVHPELEISFMSGDFLPVSAHKGINIDKLFELLQ